MNFGIDGQQGTVREVMNGEEVLAGELTSDQRLSDDWGGLSWSYPLTSQMITCLAARLPDLPAMQSGRLMFRRGRQVGKIINDKIN